MIRGPLGMTIGDTIPIRPYGEDDQERDAVSTAEEIAAVCMHRSNQLKERIGYLEAEMSRLSLETQHAREELAHIMRIHESTKTVASPLKMQTMHPSAAQIGGVPVQFGDTGG